MAGAEVLDEAAEQVVVGAAEGAERDRAAAEVAYLADRLGGFARRGHRALGVRAQQAARLGQLEPAADAREQRHAELGLEPADLLGHARLGHEQALGGGGEGPVVGRGEEVRELLQRHRLSLSIVKSTKGTAMRHKRRYWVHDRTHSRDGARSGFRRQVRCRGPARIRRAHSPRLAPNTPPQAERHASRHDAPPPPPLLPQLAKSAKALPTGGDWSYEPKWDGFRAIAFVDGDEIYLQSRNGRPLRRYFPELEFPAGQYVLDGEIVLFDADGRQDFDALGQRVHPAESRIRMLAEQTPTRFIAFDLLADDGEVLMDLPYRERRATARAARRRSPST